MPLHTRDVAALRIESIQPRKVKPMGIFNPLAGLKAQVLGAIGIAMTLSLVIALAWGFRVDHLRARYLDRLNSIRITLESVTGTKPSLKDTPAGVKDLAADYRLAKTERDEARGVVDLQTASIDRLEQETQEAAQKSVAQAKLIAATKRERDAWIKRAREAETRVERLTAEQELAECEQVLDSLYARGF